MIQFMIFFSHLSVLVIYEIISDSPISLSVQGPAGSKSSSHGPIGKKDSAIENASNLNAALNVSRTLQQKCHYYYFLYRIYKYNGVTTNWKCTYVRRTSSLSLESQTPGCPVEISTWDLPCGRQACWPLSYATPITWLRHTNITVYFKHIFNITGGKLQIR